MHMKEKGLFAVLPDESKGSLGIHLTLDQTGSIKLGPSADWVENRVEDYDVNPALIDRFYDEAKLYIKDLKKLLSKES